MRKHKLVHRVIVACPKYLGERVLEGGCLPKGEGTTGNRWALLPWLERGGGKGWPAAG